MIRQTADEGTTSIAPSHPLLGVEVVAPIRRVHVLVVQVAPGVAFRRDDVHNEEWMDRPIPTQDGLQVEGTLPSSSLLGKGAVDGANF